MPKKLPSFWITVDTREQQGWTWDSEEKLPGRCQVLGMQIDTLETGDYTIAGLEDSILIERKKSIEELFGNNIPAKNKRRFEAEMERMRDVEHKYIIVEQNLDDAMAYQVPQMRNIPSKRIVDWLVKLNLEYGVQIIFAGNQGKRYARMIFENYARKYLC